MKSKPTLWFVAGLLGVAALASAQESDRSSLWTLPVLRGETVNVSYSAGSLDRAVRVQRTFERLSARVSGWTDRKTPLAIYVLSREEWERVGLGLPYGFPARFPMQILALAAWGDEGTVELWSDLMQGQPPPAGQPEMVRGGPEEAASLRVGDLLGQLEGARILLENAGLGAAELWSGEVLAHTVLLSAWLKDGAAEADRMGRVAATLRPPGAAPLSLADYRPGVAMEEWLAFQAAFHEGARVLTGKAGPKAGRALVKLTRKSGGTLPTSRLFERFPELAAWHRSTFRLAPAGP
ncbi:MAG: hypothetical protein R3325_13475 [Thermoanaerobaculia bacterium]|nr:hypothetical protein [Thermoanaerobaculia bacterium]